jgi:hypothetical protein
VPSRDEWESSLPKFRGEEWEVPAEHLLDFHDFIHRLHIVHEDVQIKIFRYSLEGISHDWCRSLPIASIISLTGFHATFNSFCKEYFSAEHLLEECCDEFSLLHKDSASHENQICDEAFIVEESIYHEDQEVLNDIHYDSNNIETSGIISDVSVVLNVYEDQHVSFEYSDVKEQVYTSAEESYGSELHAYGKGEQKGLDEKLMMHVSLSVVEQQQVLYKFQDPVATYMEMFCSDEVSVVAIFKARFLDCKYDFQVYDLHVAVCVFMTLHKVGRKVQVVSQILAWLHWKHDLT